MESGLGGLTIAYVPDALGTDPTAPVWGHLPAYTIPLRRQEIVPPFGGGATQELRVQTAHNGKAVVWRFEWKDSTRNDRLGVRDFRDAVAVQFPAGLSKVPNPFMGDRENLVNIWQWKAELQREANEGRNVSPVEDLLAAGFGTLTKQPSQDVLGSGTYADGRWQVVLLRPLEVSDLDDARFVPGFRTRVNFAVWDGAADERDGHKSVTYQWFDVAVATANGGSPEQPPRSFPREEE